MDILYVTSEAAPFCKTGGLADVLGSLPPAVAAGGDRAAVILPLYGQVSDAWREKMRWHGYTYVDLAWRHEYCGLFSLEYRGVVWYFLDNERYFRRGALYGQMDDGERFAFFSKAVALWSATASLAARMCSRRVSAHSAAPASSWVRPQHSPCKAPHSAKPASKLAHSSRICRTESGFENQRSIKNRPLFWK